MSERVADDKVECAVAEWQPLSRRFHVGATGIAPPCHGDQCRRGVNAYRGDIARLQHAAEAPFAAADVQGVLGRTCKRAGKHHGIEDVATAEVPDSPMSATQAFAESCQPLSMGEDRTRRAAP